MPNDPQYRHRLTIMRLIRRAYEAGFISAEDCFHACVAVSIDNY